MTAAVFAFPTTIVFGPGSAGELHGRLAALGARKPFIVTDPGFRATRAFESARGACPELSEIFSDVQGNPTEANVKAATAAFRDRGCDAVIGLGGGSALDVAKIIRLGAKHPNWTLRDPVPDYVGDLAPFVAIPTTAGTGSEVGRSSVITIDSSKRVIFHPSLLAKLVILDPQLTVDLPANITAATGADALTHCIESFTSPEFHPLCDGIALEGIRLIADALPRAVKEPNDLDARGKMLIAATMGGIAFQKDLGAAHSLAHPLSAICGLHHGLANALVLPAVMKFNAERKPWLYERVGKAMGLTNADDECTIRAIESLLRDVDISGGLRGHGVTDDKLDPLADAALADSCHKTNPVPVTRDDLLQLYREAM
jgi:alcohol dehydrogenase class IV